MPELPEVETIRRQLSEKLIGRKINKQKIVGLRRRAKILIIDLANGSSLIFHLKMTGQLIFNGKPSRYTRKVFKFEDGSRLVFNDIRKFGWSKLVKNTAELEKSFGPEALEIKFKEFREILRKKANSKIKPCLMNQKVIAGIGNIYSDEILFASQVNPLRLVKSLTEKEKEKLFQNVKLILKKAIKYQGSSVGQYFDANGQPGKYAKFHKVYQQKRCSRCGAKINKVKISGRSANFCPKCQK